MVACNPTFDETRVCKWSLSPGGPSTTPRKWRQERQQVARPYPRPLHGVPTWRSLPGKASPAATWARLPSLAFAATFPSHMASGARASSKIFWRSSAREPSRALGREVGHRFQATRRGQGFCVTEVRPGSGAELLAPPVDLSGRPRRRRCRRKRNALNLR